MSDISLSCVFLATEYGTVSTQRIPLARDERLDPGESPLTAADIDAERTASIRHNEDRIQRELAEMRARLDELETRMALSDEAAGDR